MIRVREDPLTGTAEPVLFITNEKMMEKDGEPQGEEPSADELLPPTCVQRKGDNPEEEQTAPMNEELTVLRGNRVELIVQEDPRVTKERREDFFESEITCCPRGTCQ